MGRTGAEERLAILRRLEEKKKNKDEVGNGRRSQDEARRVVERSLCCTVHSAATAPGYKWRALTDHPTWADRPWHLTSVWGINESISDNPSHSRISNSHSHLLTILRTPRSGKQTVESSSGRCAATQERTIITKIMSCQKCRQPLKLDGSLENLNPAAYDLLICK